MQTEIVMSKTFGPPDKLANGKRKKNTVNCDKPSVKLNTSLHSQAPLNGLPFKHRTTLFFKSQIMSYKLEQ